MKTRFLMTWILGLLLLTMPVVAENKGIVQSLESKDVEQLCGYFDENVRLTIPKVVGVFPKIEAREKLMAFFSKNKQKTFKMIHDGVRNDNQYIIGEVRTTSATYRLQLLIRSVEGEPRIRQVRIN